MAGQAGRRVALIRLKERREIDKLRERTRSPKSCRDDAAALSSSAPPPRLLVRDRRRSRFTVTHAILPTAVSDSLAVAQAVVVAVVVLTCPCHCQGREGETKSRGFYRWDQHFLTLISEDYGRARAERMVEVNTDL